MGDGRVREEAREPKGCGEVGPYATHDTNAQPYGSQEPSSTPRARWRHDRSPTSILKTHLAKPSSPNKSSIVSNYSIVVKSKRCRGAGKQTGAKPSL